MRLPYQIRNTDGVYGLHAIEDLEIGSEVIKLSGTYRKKASRTSIQIGERHLESPYGSYINHNCNANTLLMIVIKNLEGEKALVPWYSKIAGTLTSMVIGDPYPALISTTFIPKDNEITYNYNHSESVLANPFQCNCCGNWIYGKDHQHTKQKSMEVYEHRGYE